MDKWLERAIFINIILLLAFIAMDYFCWMVIVIEPPIPATSFRQINSVGARAFYGVFVRLFAVYANLGTPEYWWYSPNKGMSLNLPLIVVLIVIATNLVIIWGLERER